MFWKEKYENVLSGNNGMTIMTVFKRVIHSSGADPPTERFSKIGTEGSAFQLASLALGSVAQF